jgi:glycosyltransferase involved in cell wall biosynthesis
MLAWTFRQLAFRYPNSTLVTYNLSAEAEATGKKWLRNQLPWIAIVADCSERDILRIERLAGIGARFVFLSWALAERFAHIGALHLDGGIDRLPVVVERRRSAPLKVIVYSGDLGVYGGAKQLVLGFSCLQRQDVELWLTGKAPATELLAAARCDSRVKYLGLLERDQLERVWEQADLFVNPRATAVRANRYNFPSKILEYLASGRPVLTTVTEGLDPEYLNHAFPLVDESPEAFALALERVLTISPDESAARGERARAWLTSERSWTRQARRFLEWEAGIK